MPTVVIDNVKGTDLPPEWLKETGEKSNQIFEVTIEVKENAKPQELQSNDSKKFKNSVTQFHYLTAKTDRIEMEKLIDEAVRSVRKINK